MRKWFWLALLVVVAIAVVAALDSSHIIRFEPDAASVESSNSNAAAIPQVTAPNVDAKQLIRHIKALN